MKRRSVLQASVVGVAAGSLLANTAVAGSNKGGKFAGAVYYTKENPGRWEKKAAGHLPVVQTEVKDGKKMVTVTTPHEMTSEHYIVKHTLLDEKMNVLGERVFYPGKDAAAISSYDVQDYKGKVYAVSMCNKHDTWLAESRVS
ncbi:MAG: desulfoferrodoxin family protein [Ketobacteraceae bacterium]|nr:desulfoferrodoxin family protein [Ketobacteraceae bacterium]